MLHTQRPVNFVKQPVAINPDSLSAHGLTEQRYEARKWPIHYDFVEPLAILADIAIIVVASIASGLLYQSLQDTGTGDYVSKSLGSAILVSTLFISLMKMRGMYRPAELLVLANQIRAVCLTWITVFLLLAGAIFALKIGSEISRGTSIFFAMFGLMALIVHRRVTEFMLVKGLAEKRFSGRNVVLITDEFGQGQRDADPGARRHRLSRQEKLRFPGINCGAGSGAT